MANALTPETPPNDTERGKYPYGHPGKQPPYADRFPFFERPPDDTPLVFEDIENWERLKYELIMSPTRYPSTARYWGVSLEQLEQLGIGRPGRAISVGVQTDDDPPPPYEPSHAGREEPAARPGRWIRFGVGNREQGNDIWNKIISLQLLHT
jgi:hypothetical protein